MTETEVQELLRKIHKIKLPEDVGNKSFQEGMLCARTALITVITRLILEGMQND